MLKAESSMLSREGSGRAPDLTRSLPIPIKLSGGKRAEKGEGVALGPPFEGLVEVGAT